MEANKNLEVLLDKLPDEPSAQVKNQVRIAMHKWMPNTCEVIDGALDAMIEEKQDYPMLFFNIPGTGKSTFALNTNVYMADYLHRKHNIPNRFSLKNSSWRGDQYLQILEAPAKDLVEIENYRMLEEFQEKWRGTVFFLDEAQDLNALESLNTFNIAINKIIATIRALQLIYSICIDFPSKLLTDIRQGRIKTAFYVMIHPKTFKNEQGLIKNRRAAFLYGRKEWIPIAVAENKILRTSMLTPERFIANFPARHQEFIPPFPDSDFLMKYDLLKFQNMGHTTLKEIEKIRKRQGKFEVPRHVSHDVVDSIIENV